MISDNYESFAPYTPSCYVAFPEHWQPRLQPELPILVSSELASQHFHAGWDVNPTFLKLGGIMISHAVTVKLGYPGIEGPLLL